MHRSRWVVRRRFNKSNGMKERKTNDRSHGKRANCTPCRTWTKGSSRLALGASSLQDVDATHPALSVETSLSSPVHGLVPACPASCLVIAVRIRHGEDRGWPYGAAGGRSSRRAARIRGDGPARGERERRRSREIRASREKGRLNPDAIVGTLIE